VANIRAVGAAGLVGLLAVAGVGCKTRVDIDGERLKTELERVPGVLPLSQTGVVSVQADKGSVEWRRRFAAMLTT